jgi:cytochrome c biogenesis factor
MIVQTQFLVGLALYVFSPMVRYFLQNFGTAVHERDARFFGMEHITMMFIAVAVISAGSLKSKKRKTDRDKFKVIAISFGVTLLIIFLSIPWEFSPFTRRPYFRGF